MVSMGGVYRWKGGVCLIAYILPKAQPEMALSILHISYFLQNCKKGKPDEMDLPYENDITTNWNVAKTQDT